MNYKLAATYTPVHKATLPFIHCICDCSSFLWEFSPKPEFMAVFLSLNKSHLRSPQLGCSILRDVFFYQNAFPYPIKIFIKHYAPIKLSIYSKNT